MPHGTTQVPCGNFYAIPGTLQRMVELLTYFMANRVILLSGETLQSRRNSKGPYCSKMARVWGGSRPVTPFACFGILSKHIHKCMLERPISEAIG